VSCPDGTFSFSEAFGCVSEGGFAKNFRGIVPFCACEALGQVPKTNFVVR
jgi:hypothetical protein